MSFWDFTRSPASVRLMANFGGEQGIPVTQLLAGTALSVTQLEDPNLQVTARQELRVADNLLRLTKNKAGLGLQVGLRYHFPVYGLWGYGLIASATAGEALALGLRFLPLTYAFTRITYREEGALGILRFGEPEVDEDVRRFLVERDMAAAALLLGEVTGPGYSLTRFTLRSEAGKRPAESFEIGGVEPEYGAHANSLVFERAMLARPLPLANPVTVAMCEQMCQQLIEDRRMRLGTAAMIRHYMNVTPGVMPSTLEAMAAFLNTSERTLKRRLQKEGATFREILNETRSAMAIELLCESSLPLLDIAERLGFSDLSSFSQAFRRWHAQTPSAYRKHARDER